MPWCGVRFAASTALRAVCEPAVARAALTVFLSPFGVVTFDGIGGDHVHRDRCQCGLTRGEHAALTVSRLDGAVGVANGVQRQPDTPVATDSMKSLPSAGSVRTFVIEDQLGRVQVQQLSGANGLGVGGDGCGVVSHGDFS
jgi:hypothetical protein